VNTAAGGYRLGAFSEFRIPASASRGDAGITGNPRGDATFDRCRSMIARRRTTPPASPMTMANAMLAPGSPRMLEKASQTATASIGIPMSIKTIAIPTEGSGLYCAPQFSQT
jgi:hypothetical protein